MPDSTPRKKWARSKSRDCLKRVNGRAGSVPNQGKQMQTHRLWLALWCLVQWCGSLHSYPLFTKQEWDPREQHRDCRDLGFPQPSWQHQKPCSLLNHLSWCDSMRIPQRPPIPTPRLCTGTLYPTKWQRLAHFCRTRRIPSRQQNGGTQCISSVQQNGGAVRTSANNAYILWLTPFCEQREAQPPATASPLITSGIASSNTSVQHQKCNHK